jgi:hypothetical protein
MDLLDKIEKKYKKHKQFNEYLKDDIESAKNDLEYFYHFKRLGYHLIHIFKDEKLSRETFEYAIDNTSTTAEDMKDIIMDITFLSEDWAKELQETYEIDIND